jgi:L,D-peptidoglycan transpeptidase YkuD (ErfK/YbiS/YcfS/YnhG family)
LLRRNLRPQQRMVREKLIQARRVVIRTLSRRNSSGMLICGNLRFRCALGRAGSKAVKHEGDGASPSGTYAVRQTYYRGDKLLRPRSTLPLRRLRPDDGWCDAVSDRNYNRHVRHPYPASAESLWRRDGLYDLIVVLGYNDRPRVQGRGSAIFMHVAKPGYRPTEGCIALKRSDLKKLLAVIGPRTRIVLP